MEERAILDQRASERAAELMLAQGGLLLHAVDGRVERVRRVERLVAEVFEGSAVERIGAGLGDDGDLSARARAVLGRVVVRVDAELLNVFETRLETEGRGQFSVEVAGRRVDDRGALDAVIANDVLLHRAAGETNVAERARARVYGARGLQVELRELSAVDGELADLALVDVGAIARGGQVEGGRFSSDVDRFAEVRGLEGEVEVHFLSGGHLLGLELGGGETGELSLDRINGRFEAEDHVATFRGGHRIPCIPRVVVRDDVRRPSSVWALAAPAANIRVTPKRRPSGRLRYVNMNDPPRNID